MFLETPNITNYSWDGAFVFHIRSVCSDELVYVIADNLRRLEVVAKYTVISFLPQKVNRG